MASTYTVISLALSKLGVAGAAKAPRQTDLDLGLTTLQALYRSLISSGALGRARPVYPTGDYMARENDRIYRNSTSIGSITFPEFVTDAQDCALGYYYDDDHCSGPRPPRDGAFVVINNANTGGTQEYIYEAYTARWISVHDLSLQQAADIMSSAGHVIGRQEASEAPLSTRDLNGLAALLAVKLADHYGAQPSPLTIRDAINWEAGLANAFGEPEREMINDLVPFGHGRRY